MDQMTVYYTMFSVSILSKDREISGLHHSHLLVKTILVEKDVVFSMVLFQQVLGQVKRPGRDARDNKSIFAWVQGSLWRKS